MGLRFFLIGMVLLFSLLCPLLIYGGSLSDMDLPTFKKKVQPSTEGGRSPFVPSRPTADELAVEDLYLSGVIMGGNEAYALVSGYIIQVGDKIAGYKVSSISVDRVVLRKLDQVYTLHLGGEI